MEDNQKDKIVELSISKEGFKIKLQNTKEGAIAKIGETIVDSLSFFRWNRAVRMYDKYNEKKNARKIQGKETPLPPKFIIEILENAFKEDNDEIQDEWTNLLVNWQDPDKNCDKKYMYIDLLKNLNVNEIRLLKSMYRDPNFEIMLSNKNAYYDKATILRALNLTEEDYEVMILNLYRLKICDTLKSGEGIMRVGNLSVHADGGIEKFRVTRLGYNLIKSCEEE